MFRFGFVLGLIVLFVPWPSHARCRWASVAGIGESLYEKYGPPSRKAVARPFTPWLKDRYRKEAARLGTGDSDFDAYLAQGGDPVTYRDPAFALTRLWEVQKRQLADKRLTNLEATHFFHHVDSIAAALKAGPEDEARSDRDRLELAGRLAEKEIEHTLQGKISLSDVAALTREIRTLATEAHSKKKKRELALWRLEQFAKRRGLSEVADEISGLRRGPKEKAGVDFELVGEKVLRTDLAKFPDYNEISRYLSRSLRRKMLSGEYAEYLEKGGDPLKFHPAFLKSFQTAYRHLIDGQRLTVEEKAFLKQTLAEIVEREQLAIAAKPRQLEDLPKEAVEARLAELARDTEKRAEFVACARRAWFYFWFSGTINTIAVTRHGWAKYTKGTKAFGRKSALDLVNTGVENTRAIASAILEDPDWWHNQAWALSITASLGTLNCFMPPTSVEQGFSLPNLLKANLVVGAISGGFSTATQLIVEQKHPLSLDFARQVFLDSAYIFAVTTNKSKLAMWAINKYNLPWTKEALVLFLSESFGSTLYPILNDWSKKVLLEALGADEPAH